MKGNEIKILNAVYRNPRTINRNNIRTYLDEIYGKQGFEWMDSDKYYLPLKTARLMTQLGKEDSEENAVAFGEEWQKVVELNRRLFEKSSLKRKELLYNRGVVQVLDDMQKKDT